MDTPFTAIPDGQAAEPVRLSLRNLGHVPSFKNSKMILWDKRRIMTKPEIQEWMERAIQSFESQFNSEFRIRGIEIMTVHTPLSQIASLLPLDDSRQWMPEHCVSTLIVPKGQEGADITIERLPYHSDR